MRKMETVDAEVMRMRKDSLCWRWMEQREMQCGGRLRSGCWSLLSDYGPAGDKILKDYFKKRF